MNRTDLVDMQVRCEDCPVIFTWTIGEQLFLEQLVSEGKMKEVVRPKRCPECRAKKKAKYAKKENA